jgi:c-di-GMP-related signal transduction protein
VEFLQVSQKQLLQELLLTKDVAKNHEQVAAKLDVINALGTLIDLPKIVEYLKNQNVDRDAKVAQMKVAASDPLAKDGA